MSVREVTFDDLNAVDRLFEAAGWAVPSREHWSRLWIDNPAVQIPRPRPSCGWVMEQNGRVIGFLGNLAQLYKWQGETLRSATAFCFFVLPEFRGSSLQLVLPFIRQSNVDLLLNTTASPEASQIFQFLKFARLPQADFDVSYYWATHSAGFLGAALRKKDVPRPISDLLAAATAPALWLENRLRSRCMAPPRSSATRIDVVRAEEAGAEFDDFWQRKSAEKNQLLAVRTSEVLRHRFAGESRSHPPQIIRAWDGQRLVGYAILVRADTDKIGLKRCRLADLMAERDDPTIVQDLLAAAYGQTRRHGIHMFEIIGYPAHIRRIVEYGRPYRLRNEAWPYLYKAHNPTLHAALGSADAWYATLLDGDGC
jgi:hypothetical protein